MHDHLKFQETQEEAELKVDCQQEEMTKTAAMQSPMSSEEPQRFVNQHTDKRNKITITNDKGHLTKEDIESIVMDAESYYYNDEKKRDRTAARKVL
ncbi:Heat shock cognate 71 kDa protein [Tyrophagus putrescentiae]|nr:Heat shock cognate 71 kDa protein [Tyrophagus putrescentiae]